MAAVLPVPALLQPQMFTQVVKDVDVNDFQWGSAVEVALVKVARQAQFDFDKAAKALKGGVLRGVVRTPFGSICEEIYQRSCECGSCRSLARRQRR